MVEKHMEDLIAGFPKDFFPRKEMVLKGRQKSFAGIGRFDLLFLDEFETQILMELKAVQARYEDATQLAKYKDELEARGEKNILMWLVAPQIPKSVRDFLDRIGIEYSEIHEAEFRQVANRHGISLETPVVEAQRSEERWDKPAPRPSRPFVARNFGRFDPSAEGYPMKADFDRRELKRLLDAFTGAVRRQQDTTLALHLDEQLLQRDPPAIERGTFQRLAKWCETNNPVYWDGMDIARKISNLLFGRVLDRKQLGV